MMTEKERSRQNKDDQDVVIKYIKEDLFPKVKFLYGPDDLAVGGQIYMDYKNKCKNQIGDVGLTTASHKTYMEAVWNASLIKQIQKNALAQKRSAVYTVMQNKFSGMSITNLSSKPVAFMLLMLANTFDIKHGDGI
jgi:hypothetical protein